MANSNYHKITISMSKHMDEWITLLAKDKQISKSAMIRHALELYLGFSEFSEVTKVYTKTKIDSQV